jgi:hypothetical protein
VIEFPGSSSDVGEVEGGQSRVLNKRADDVDKCNPRISDARANERASTSRLVILGGGGFDR